METFYKILVLWIQALEPSANLSCETSARADGSLTQLRSHAHTHDRNETDFQVRGPLNIRNKQMYVAQVQAKERNNMQTSFFLGSNESSHARDKTESNTYIAGLAATFLVDGQLFFLCSWRVGLVALRQHACVSQGATSHSMHDAYPCPFFH